METSAKEGTNVNELFEELLKQKINFPIISKKPKKNGKWLVKEYQSFGGVKVKPFKQAHNINKKGQRQHQTSLKHALFS